MVASKLGRSDENPTELRKATQPTKLRARRKLQRSRRGRLRKGKAAKDGIRETPDLRPYPTEEDASRTPSIKAQYGQHRAHSATQHAARQRQHHPDVAITPPTASRATSKPAREAASTPPNDFPLPSRNESEARVASAHQIEKGSSRPARRARTLQRVPGNSRSSRSAPPRPGNRDAAAIDDLFYDSDSSSAVSYAAIVPHRTYAKANDTPDRPRSIGQRSAAHRAVRSLGKPQQHRMPRSPIHRGGPQKRTYGGSAPRGGGDDEMDIFSDLV